MLGRAIAGDRSPSRRLRLLLPPLVLLLCNPLPSSAQETVLLSFGIEDRYEIVEKHNFSVYVNGRYQGFTYREIRGILRRSSPEEYTGNYFVLQETRRENRLLPNALDVSVPVRLAVGPDQHLIPTDPSSPFPLLRGVPSFPSETLKPGEQWEASADVVVDPTAEERYTRVRVLIRYEYAGISDYNGRNVHSINGDYALRYRGDDRFGDPRLIETNGRRTFTLLIDAENGRPVLMRTNLEELYAFADGTRREHRGFILRFYEGIAPLAINRLAQEIEQRLEEEGIEDVTIEETSEGLRLGLRDLFFVANEAILLPEERARLNSIARALSEIEGRSFLVTGHTADIGLADSQQQLSVDRARAIVDAMVERGLDPDRFYYRGLGGTDPVASNETEAGRAQNRRVEITILEN